MFLAINQGDQLFDLGALRVHLASHILHLCFHLILLSLHLLSEVTVLHFEAVDFVLGVLDMRLNMIKSAGVVLDSDSQPIDLIKKIIETYIRQSLFHLPDNDVNALLEFLQLALLDDLSYLFNGHLE